MKKLAMISLIDDDTIYQLLTRKMIENAGYAETILQFSDGQEALDYLVKYQHEEDKLPDLVFLDLEMPFMDGWQFLNEFKDITFKKLITIYITSSSNNLADQEKAKHFNEVRGYIIKPISKQQLLEIIENF